MQQKSVNKGNDSPDYLTSKLVVKALEDLAVVKEKTDVYFK